MEGIKASMNKSLADDDCLGTEAGAGELGESNDFLSGVLNHLDKDFGHLFKAYTYGHGVIDFPT